MMIPASFYRKPMGVLETMIDGTEESVASFWTTGDEDYPCVHINDVVRLLDEIERLRTLRYDD